jgi:hypothetical protein
LLLSLKENGIYSEDTKSSGSFKEKILWRSIA